MRLKLGIPGFLLIGVLLIEAGALAANHPLRITNIDNVGALNRIYFAYTGLEYQIRVAVEGGLYPYSFELTSAPAGMSIDKQTGEILWSNPTEDGSPYTCTVKVTDSEGNSVTASWAISVSTDPEKFHFVDSINGKSRSEGGTGTINNPWKNIRDFYLGQDDSSYAGDIIYFRTGTYTLWHEPGTNDNERGVGSDRIPFNSNHPVAYLAYPGENPIINLESTGNSGKHFWLLNADNYYFYGLKFQNVWNYALEIANSKYVTVYKCRFDNMGCSATYANQAYVAYFGVESQSYYNVIQDNVMIGGTGSWVTGVKAYGLYHSVIEDNRIQGMTDFGISIKSHSDYNTIRHNVVKNCVKGIGAAGYGHTNNNEYCFNLILDSGEIPLYFNDSGTIASTYIYRNTVNAFPPRFRIIESDDRIFHIYNNVFVNESVESSFYGSDFIKNKCRFLYLPQGSEESIYHNNFDFQNNLLGTASDNIIDSNGDFATAYSEYISVCGWQILGDGNSGSPPGPPTLHEPN